MVLFFFCRFFFTSSGEKEPTRCIQNLVYIYTTYAVGVWGRQAAPKDLLVSPVQGDFVALHGRKERFLEGLQPSKPPRSRRPRNSCIFTEDHRRPGVVPTARPAQSAARMSAPDPAQSRNYPPGHARAPPSSPPAHQGQLDRSVAPGRR